MSDLIRMPTEGDWVDNRFLLQQCLGRGGFGIVYKARQRNLQRHVAVKMLLPHALDKPTVTGRFKREAQLASSLHHPNTVLVHSYGTHLWEDGAPGVPFLVMEYLVGETLQSYLNRVGFLPPDATLDILLQVLGSLSEAHAQGIIHRDIKPGNIFLCTRNGMPSLVKVLDFGIAKAFDRSGQSAEGEVLTGTGVIPGTVDYMAPDLAMGDGTQTPAIDVYALGCTAYRMVTGVVPFQGKTPLEVSIKHVSSPLPMLPAELGTHPLVGMIHKAMAKSPADRFPDAVAFAKAIRAIRPDSNTWSNSWVGLPPIQGAERFESGEGEPLSEAMLAGGLAVSSRGASGGRLAASSPSLAPGRKRDPLDADEFTEMENEVHIPLAHTGRGPQMWTGPDPEPRVVISPIGAPPKGGLHRNARLFDVLSLAAVGLLVVLVLGVIAVVSQQDPQGSGDPSVPRSLRVDSNPPGAIIYYGQERLGLTPYTFAHPNGAGPLTLTLFKRGYKVYEIHFDDETGDNVAVDLQPDPTAATDPPP
jgi:serine/threonine-protein kinase